MKNYFLNRLKFNGMMKMVETLKKSYLNSNLFIKNIRINTRNYPIQGRKLQKKAEETQVC